MRTTQKALFAGIVALFCVLPSCADDPNNVTGPLAAVIDKSALERTALQDGFVSTELAPLNDNESEPVDIMRHIYPAHGPREKIKLVRKTRLISHTSSLNPTSDSTAVLTLQKKTSGEAVIAAVTFTDSSKSWVVFRKPLEETFTRKILFINKQDSKNHDDDQDDNEEDDDNDSGKIEWKKLALSLMEGGTTVRSARIVEISIVFSDTTIFSVTSPLDFYLYWKKYKPLFPHCWKEREVQIKVRVESSKPDPEIVLVRRGSAEHGRVSMKQQLDLTSETNTNGVYERLYEISMSPHFNKGSFHSLVEVWTHESLYDSTAQVSTHVWGMPYTVH
ncbi:MAG: hypothetical protein HYV29_07650 [Ignavibacteriales bacterium]|nr:hypothetical protein [Ignavibacteriales bacterium]